MNIILFSKNRPWQLQQTLASIKRFLPKAKMISVLVKADPEYCFAYGKIAIEFPLVRFTYEHQGFSCWDFFKREVRFAPNESLIALMVDDTVMIDEPVIQTNFLLDNPDFVQSLRLSPDISWCQPANAPSQMRNAIKLDFTYLLPYATATGQMGDFAYPFDLSASVYSKEFLERFILGLEIHSDFRPSHALKIPNDIEAVFYTRLHGMRQNVGIIFEESATAKVLTINRVQDQYTNPIDAGKEVSTADTLQFLKDGKRLDFSAYLADKYKRQIHISDIILHETQN